MTSMVTPSFVGAATLDDSQIINIDQLAGSDPRLPIPPNPPIPDWQLTGWHVSNFGPHDRPVFYKVATYEKSTLLYENDDVACGSDVQVSYEATVGATQEAQDAVSVEIGKSVSHASSFSATESEGAFGISAEQTETTENSEETSSALSREFSSIHTTQTSDTKTYNFDWTDTTAYDASYSVFQNIKMTQIVQMSYPFLYFLYAQEANLESWLEDTKSVLKNSPNDENAKANLIAFNDALTLTQTKISQGLAIVEYTPLYKSSPSDSLEPISTIQLLEYGSYQPVRTFADVPCAESQLEGFHTKTKNSNISESIYFVGTSENNDSPIDNTIHYVQVIIKFTKDSIDEDGNITPVLHEFDIVTKAYIEKDGDIQPFGWPSDFPNYGDKVTPDDLPEDILIQMDDFDIVVDNESWILNHSLGHKTAQIGERLVITIPDLDGIQTHAQITDENNLTVPGAKVTIEGQTQSTDEFGVAYFHDLIMSHSNFTEITATHPNYEDASLLVKFESHLDTPDLTIPTNPVNLTCQEKVFLESTRGKIVCVTPSTATKLVERGWGTILD